MIQKFINSLKIKDYIYFTLFIILFFLVFRRNNKEKFTSQSPTSDTEFQTKVKSVLSDNYQSIQNLSTLSSKISSPGSVLDLSGVHLKVKDLGLKFGTQFINIRTETQTTLPTSIDTKTKINTDNFNNLKNKYNSLINKLADTNLVPFTNQTVSQVRGRAEQPCGNGLAGLGCRAIKEQSLPILTSKTNFINNYKLN